MSDRFVKIFEIKDKKISGTKLVNKEEMEKLRGKVVVINPEGEIPKKLEIREKGVYGAKFK